MVLHWVLLYARTLTFLLAVFAVLVKGEVEGSYCKIDQSSSTGICTKGASTALLNRYLLYDVNPPEGFNLRRDVYMRLAIFIKGLKTNGRWNLVLPPWGRLYHWQSTNLGQQEILPWSMFFDVSSMQKFAPVIEMGEFLMKTPKNEPAIQEVFVLQHYSDMWEEGREWKDKWNIEPCRDSIPYNKAEGSFIGPFWGFNNITAKEVSCVSFQGHAALLKEILVKSRSTSIMIDHAEIALHDIYGDSTYWEARRSMRFASELVKIAASFRKTNLNSTDEADGTLRPVDWREEEKRRNTLGGPYLAVHLRRKDFLWGRSEEVSDLKFAAEQLKDLLLKHNLDVLFVATDAPKSEFAELKSLLSKFKVVKFDPSTTVKNKLKDGGIAIVDQIICSHARFFTGTYESTFSFRIQEEREIMGFNEDMTFNRLCGRDRSTCTQPTKWTIVF